MPNRNKTPSYFASQKKHAFPYEAWIPAFAGMTRR
ncbi:hypothetical protein H4684_001248 [Desulfomicrobium macestii]|uniref:Uncharacterized protein n=2 Tax=Desulfomicrobium TaxID=898 RepID=A0A8G2C4I1_DESNO|nr:hypothetical protein [Desulfomicrobium macestii]SFL97500.1 hypothetical protein SAMN05421830_110118 [Desulfomicrobium norvegicum]